ncbi:nucleoside phosphorylase domain-containing protein [Aspergillus cavernicola]|uniref:Nucleoside phosphorylase domain-containing protein n=1 Tax=Aspergillus cavernicola TaxID=176166 RepID=A0ABR4J0Z7_9EURO
MTLTHDDYMVAWICALPLELAAAKAMLDEILPSLLQPKSEHNAYTHGRISDHNVVVACLPSGVYGTISASAVVSHLVSTYPNIRFGLVVGVGGGVPSESADIRLGDVVVGKPTATSPAYSGSLNKPPTVLLKALAQMEADSVLGKSSSVTGFQATYDHVRTEPTCSLCDQNQLVRRPTRGTEEPYIHYGVIASGDQVIKDAKTRDLVARERDILCFEMEDAGLMDELPSLAIRGICDYCDSHKNKQWQEYAALSAAACAKSLLSIVPVWRLNSQRSVRPAYEACF